MDSSDLFSFLAEGHSAETPMNVDSDVAEAANASSVIAKKRKALTPTDTTFNNSGGDMDASASADNDAGPSEPKKARLSSPKPVVVDEVEIEAKREVAASAGLTGAIEAGSRLELRHQVCRTVSLIADLARLCSFDP